MGNLRRRLARGLRRNHSRAGHRFRIGAAVPHLIPSKAPDVPAAAGEGVPACGRIGLVERVARGTCERKISAALDGRFLPRAMTDGCLRDE